MAQCLVADLMAIDIVDELELIDVELYEEGLLQPSAIELGLDDGFEAVAVEHAGELVRHGHLAQAPLPVVHEEQNVGQRRQHEEGRETEGGRCAK